MWADLSEMVQSDDFRKGVGLVSVDVVWNLIGRSARSLGFGFSDGKKSNWLRHSNGNAVQVSLRRVHIDARQDEVFLGWSFYSSRIDDLVRVTDRQPGEWAILSGPVIYEVPWRRGVISLDGSLVSRRDPALHLSEAIAISCVDQVSDLWDELLKADALDKAISALEAGYQWLNNRQYLDRLWAASSDDPLV